MTRYKEWEVDYVSDDMAFLDHAEPGFPWIRVVFGEKPNLPRGTKYVYVLRAHGKTTKMQADRVAWYIAGPRSYPRRARPIAYIVVDADFEINETVIAPYRP